MLHRRKISTYISASRHALRYQCNPYHKQLSTTCSCENYTIDKFLHNKSEFGIKNAGDIHRRTRSFKSIEKLYPQQHRSNVKIHNLHIHGWLVNHYPHVLYIDVYNLTKNGTDHTSDGFHSLSDVNMIKASYILNVMDAMSRNGSWYAWSTKPKQHSQKTNN